MRASALLALTRTECAPDAAYRRTPAIIRGRPSGSVALAREEASGCHRASSRSLLHVSRAGDGDLRGSSSAPAMWTRAIAWRGRRRGSRRSARGRPCTPDSAPARQIAPKSLTDAAAIIAERAAARENAERIERMCARDTSRGARGGRVLVISALPFRERFSPRESCMTSPAETQLDPSSSRCCEAGRGALAPAPVRAIRHVSSSPFSQSLHGCLFSSCPSYFYRDLWHQSLFWRLHVHLAESRPVWRSPWGLCGLLQQRSLPDEY